MFSESAEIYDTVYSALKDYRAEASKIVELLRRVAPGAVRVLDVACGTGEHARILSQEHGLLVEGVDIDASLLAVARRKNPGGAFYEADMCSFRLGRTYDAVLCLFSSIGYACTLERVTHALRCFRDHLSPTGCVLVEPWFGPDQWRPGRVDGNVAERDGLKVCRMSHASVRGRISVLTLDYLIGTSEGVEHRREIHELGLFSSSEMLSCFRDAGLTAEFDPVGLTGRGLYIGRRADSTATFA
jgi:SAM-dependent methyltransferase